ncbi:acylphosphatase [Erwinia tracheiphila PSU-1]|nr:acylphosphatase [Erwinia tracheiphila PSU-1]
MSGLGDEIAISGCSEGFNGNNHSASLGLRQGSESRISLSNSVQSKSLALKGYAHNLDDGGVEVLIIGKKEAVTKLLKWLNSGGPRSARVERILVEPCQTSEQLSGFIIG